VSTHARIRQAIKEKKIVVATYGGGGRRWLCPHVLGTRNGAWYCLFYQFRGDSGHGLAPDGSGDNWRCLEIDKLNIVAILEGEWHTAANRSRDQACVETIDTAVR
jgi:hypothetical protein